MRIALASDLHNEFYGKPPFLDVPENDLLILAGDIETASSHDQEWWDDVASKSPKIIYIRGNHEYYKSRYADFPALTFPDNVHAVGRMPRIIEHEGLRILAGTMWTDLSDPSDDFYATQRMNDYRLIYYKEGIRFTPEHSTAEWNSFRIMLGSEPDICISHHLPSYGSVNEKYANDRLNCAFATEMDMRGIKLWVHGHTHDECDYINQGCRVVCNPKGYPGENSGEYKVKVIDYATS